MAILISKTSNRKENNYFFLFEILGKLPYITSGPDVLHDLYVCLAPDYQKGDIGKIFMVLLSLAV